jgi:putative SOS response-associated peptidase YedK
MQSKAAAETCVIDGMRGRFTNRLTWSEIVRLSATPERNLPARYNICPTDTIDVVIGRNGKRELVPIQPMISPGSTFPSLRSVSSRK